MGNKERTTALPPGLGLSFIVYREKDRGWRLGLLHHAKGVIRNDKSLSSRAGIQATRSHGEA